MKWSKSSQDLTKYEWLELNRLEKYEATRFWMNQNRKHGNMTKRAAYESMRLALRRSKAIIPPITSMSKLELLAFDYKSDFLLEKFFPERRKHWRVAGRRRPLKDKEHITAISVQEFSLLDNPEAVFKTLQSLCYMEAISPPGNIDFIDDRIRDIGAYLLLSIIYQRMVKFAEGGIISSRVAKVLQAVGLTRAMKIAVSDQGLEDVYPLPLSTQSQQNMQSKTIGGETSKKEKVASEVISKVEEWLGSVGIMLPTSSLAPLGKAIGEVLNNAERHSVSEEAETDSGGWWIAGFMARRKNEDGTYRHVCHISVVGLGLTIPKTLLASPPSNDRFHPQFEDYSLRGGQELNAEQRAIILSLQDGITSKPDKSGGLGMQELISSIAYLGAGSGKDKMCIAIVSGSTCIRILPTHVLVDKQPEGHRQSWLNGRNNPEDSPDGGTVTDIGLDFPGTCISIRFELDQEHLQEQQVKQYQKSYPIESAIYKGTI